MDTTKDVPNFPYENPVDRINFLVVQKCELCASIVFRIFYYIVNACLRIVGQYEPNKNVQYLIGITCNTGLYYYFLFKN